MTKTVEQQAEAVVAAVRGYVDRQTAPLVEAQRELTVRVQQLEQRRELSYSGTFQQGVTYQTNEAVTHDGSVWIARTSTSARPGTNSDWQLAVKRGRDGKDAT
jgi:hypothetical protein